MPFAESIITLADQMTDQYNARMYKNFQPEDLLWVLGISIYDAIMKAASEYFPCESKPTHYMGIKITKCEGIEPNEFYLSIIKP